MDATSPPAGPLPYAAPETPVRLLIDGRPAVVWLCSPHEPERLALGWLRAEGWIDGRDEVARLEAEAPDRVAVSLAPEAARRLSAALPAGGPGRLGESWSPERVPRRPAAASGEVRALLADRDRLAGLFEEMFGRATRRGDGGGIHTGGLVREGELRLVAEDVGRQNVADRLAGGALAAGIPLAGCVWILSGRISAVLAAKAARCGVAAVASISVPTTLARELAWRGGVTLVGRARRGSPQIHPPPERT